MAVKRKNQKKQYKDWLVENGVKIKCCYCSLKNECKQRANKERTEKLGIVTRCVITPNRKKKLTKRPKRVI